MPREETFSEVFKKEIDAIELAALAAGTTLTAVCRDIGISRSTPDRWRREIPRTIAIIEKMRARVAAVQKEKERKAVTA